MSEKITKLHISLSSPENELDEEDLFDLQSEIFGDLSQMEVEQVELGSSGPAPEGTKGLEAWGAEIAVGVAVYYVPAIVNYFKGLLKTKHQAPSIKLEVEVDGKLMKLELDKESINSVEVQEFLKKLTG